MKKVCFLIFLIIVGISLCSCWGLTNINELNILHGIGFDLYDNEYFMITEGITPVGQTPDSKQTQNTPEYYYAIGKSIFDAARNMTSNATGKRSYYQTCQIIAIGENLCKTDITPVIDFFTRDPKRRTTVYPVIVDGDVKDFFLKNKNKKQPLSTEILDIIKLYKYTGYAVNMNLANTVTASKRIAGTVLINRFMYTNTDKNISNDKIILEGTGVFYKNKLIGYFDLKDTMVANIMSKRIDKGVLVINDTGNTNPYRNISIELADFKTKLIPEIKSDKYIMNIDIFTNATITQYNGDKSLINYNYDMLCKQIEEYLSELINMTFLKCKNEFKVDVFEFGDSFARKYKYITKMQPEEWNDIFSKDVELNMKIKVNIMSTGISTEKSD